MYLSDYHLHTSFSTDCETPMENAVHSAIHKGLREIACTDHVDFDCPGGQPGDFMVDYDDYLVTFNKLKNQYLNSIQMVLGVEIGCQPHVIGEIDSLLRQYPFDFVILSTHTVDKINCSTREFYAGREKKNAYQSYLEGVLTNITGCQNYDVCGHLDFMVRYGPYADKSLNFRDYRETIDAILKKVIETGHGIEVNTSGYRYGLNQTHPSLEIVKRYRELGGEIITMGSDAHQAAHVGAHFEIARQVLLAAGFTRYTVFRNRKPYFVGIEKAPEKLPVSA